VVAHGSARECAYLLDLAARLKLLAAEEVDPVVQRYGRLQASLTSMVNGLLARDERLTRR